MSRIVSPATGIWSAALPLGVAATEFALPPGAAVLVYTDGLIENRLRPGSATEAHLLSYLQCNAPLDLDALLGEFGTGAFSDDVAVMSISLEP